VVRFWYNALMDRRVSLLCVALAALAAASLACSFTPEPTPTPVPPTATATTAATSAPGKTPGAGTAVPGTTPGAGTTPGVPGAPAGLAAEPDDTVVHLSWSPFAGAAGYFVYRDGGQDPLNPTPITETAYDDIGLTNGRAYTYTVAVADAAGQSGPLSAPITAVPHSK
jgi:hypothetical protein